MVFLKRFFTCFSVLVSLVFPYVALAKPINVVGVQKKDFIRISFHTVQKSTLDITPQDKTLQLSFKDNPALDMNRVINVIGEHIVSFVQEKGNLYVNLNDAHQYSYRKFISEGFIGVDIFYHNTPKTKPFSNQIASTLKVPRPILKPRFTFAKLSASPTPQLRQHFEPLAARGVRARSEHFISSNNTAHLADVLLPQDHSAQAFQVAQTISNEDIFSLVDDIVSDEWLSSSDKNSLPLTDEDTEAPWLLASNPTADNQSNVAKEGVLTFSWDSDDVASAAFIRGDYVWIVFDKYQAISTTDILDNNSSYISYIEQMYNRDYTILRFKLHKTDSYLTVSKDKNKWLVAIDEGKSQTTSNSQVDIETSDLHGSMVNITTNHYTKPLRLLDPHVGDGLVVIPVLDEGSANATRYEYSDYVILKTAQGKALQLNSDNVEIRVSENNVSVVGPANRLAANAQSVLAELKERERQAKLRAEKRLKRQNNELTLLKFNQWRRGDIAEFNKNKHEVLYNIVAANWDQKTKPRMALAQFYFAHKLYDESIGTLETVKLFDEPYSQELEYKFLKAATLYMLHRYSEAVELFETIVIHSNIDSAVAEEVRFWKAAAHLKLNNSTRLIDASTMRGRDESLEKTEEEKRIDVVKKIYDTSSELLEMIENVDTKFAEEEEVKAFEKTGQFILDHFENTLQELQTKTTKEQTTFTTEGDRLWWSTSSTIKSKKANLNFLQVESPFLGYYPNEIYNDFALLALQENIYENRLAAAEELLFSFRDDDRERFNNSTQFLIGLFYAKDEDPEKAKETWQPLTEQILDNFNRTRATFALSVYQLERNEIDLEQAISRLNSIRSAWRGDILELNNLKLLGELYMENQDYEKGFEVWRELVSSFPASDEALLMQKRMSEKFVQIFNRGDNSSLSQLEALTLFYEFRELTPIGKEGDLMISQLVDRLIQMDLLDRAIALLTHQVRFRLEGKELERATLKLVKVYLANRNPQEALNALNTIGIESDDETLARDKRFLKVKILTLLKKNNQALKLLSNDESHKAYYLRANVFWKEKVWRKVIDELEIPFKKIRRNEAQLSEEEANQLIRLAVAYGLTERKKRLKTLYEDFIKYVGNPEKRRIFSFVALDRGRIDYKNLDYTVGYNDMQSFLDQYMESESKRNSGS